MISLFMPSQPFWSSDSLLITISDNKSGIVCISIIKGSLLNTKTRAVGYSSSHHSRSNLYLIKAVGVSTLELTNDVSERFSTASTGQHCVDFSTSRLSIVDSARLDLCGVLFFLTHEKTFTMCASMWHSKDSSHHKGGFYALSIFCLSYVVPRLIDAVSDAGLAPSVT